MSTMIMSQCWPLKMPPTAKAVLVSLADNANDQGACWPSIDTICMRTCFGRDAVIDAIAWLEDAGALKGHRDNGRRTTYQITPATFDEGFTRPSRRTASRSAAANSGEDNQSGKTTGRAEPPVGQIDLTSRAERHYQSGKTIKPVGQNDTNRKEPSINRQGTIIARPAGDLVNVMEGFDVFYAAYPRKVGKAAALKAWTKLAPDAVLRTTILGALAAQRPHLDLRENKRFVPHPSTWLNEGRWDDELPAGAKPIAGADGLTWFQRAGFEHIAEAQNARCHIGNYGEFRHGKRIVDGVTA